MPETHMDTGGARAGLTERRREQSNENTKQRKNKKTIYITPPHC